MENAARSRPDARRQAREKGAKAARQKAKAFKLRFVNEDGSVHEVASKMSVPPGSRRPRASSGQRARNLEGPKAPPPPLPQQQQQQQSPPVRQTQALSMKDKVEDRITEAFKDLVATTPPTARELELELMDKWTKPAAKETKSSATKLGANRTKKSLAQEDEDEDEDESWPPIKTTRAKNFAARKSPSGLRSSMPSASRMFQNVGCGILERMSRARCGPCGIKQITYFGLMSVGVLTVFYFIKLGALMSPPFALEGTQAHEESPVVPHVKTPPAFSQEPASTFSKEAASAHLNKPRIPQTSWPVIHGEPETSKVADEYEGTGNAPLTKKQKESEPLPSKYEQNRVFPPRDDQNEDETSAFPFVEEPKPTSSSTQYNGADESNVVGSTPRVHVGQDASTFAASTFGANDVASQPHVHGTHQTTTSENRDSGASFERTDKPSRPRVHDGPHDDTIDDAAALGTPRVFDPVPASEPDSSPHPVTRDADAEKSLVAGFTAGASTPSEEIDEALAQFLQLARLSQYASALLDIGVETMEDLELLVRKDIDELKSVGMKRVQLLRLEQMLLHRPSTDPLRTSTSENEEDVDEILDARAPSLPKVDFADDQSVETYPSGKVDENSLAERKAPKSGSDHSVEYGARASNLGSKKEPKSSTLVESPKGKIAPTVSTQGDHAAESQDATSSVATNVHSQPKVDGQASENSGGDAADSFAAQDKVPSQEPAKDEVTSPISTRGNDAAESPDSASSVATNVGLRPYVEDQQNKDSEDSATDSKTKSEISRSSDLKSEHLASRPKVDFGNEEASDFDTATKTDDIGTNKNPSETEGSSPPTIFPEATGKKAPRVESIVEETSSEEKVPTPSQANVPAQPTAGTSSSKLAQEASEAIAIAPHGGPTAHDSATSMPPEDAESQDVFAPSTHDMESRKDSGFKNESPRASARPIVDASEPGSPLEPASSLKPASHASDADSRQGRRLRG